MPYLNEEDGGAIATVPTLSEYRLICVVPQTRRFLSNQPAASMGITSQRIR
jgi:hypothetical protein